MKMHFLAGLGAAITMLAACASNAPASGNYWRSTAPGGADFRSDNTSCSARASRVVPQPRADLLPGGATIVDNRIDRPPKRWTSSVAEGAYMDCMAERGWHVVTR